MSTRRCPNGHQYDPSIYGDTCPFCPSETHVIEEDRSETIGLIDSTAPTIPMEQPLPVEDESPQTILFGANRDDTSANNGRKLIAVLVSYSHNPQGVLYPIYEGNNFAGRNEGNDIRVPDDHYMSRRHFQILFTPAEGIFRLYDEHTANGLYVNGEFKREAELQSGDVIVVGATKFVFLAIPNIA
ncbi:MAG: FHA domain-containing protein [Paludibacteraceae bacterium]|nr:FHA domain-containing protein [Paludibacteraceae bacterium]